MSNQLDFFQQPPPEHAKAHASGDQFPSSTWMTRENSAGSPEYRAIREMLLYVDYLKLNPWQQRVFWPWISKLADRLEGVTSQEVLRFELGYVVGALEVEQLRSRSAALEICKKYGITF